MLFPETKYLDYKFPEPQYLGAKYIHRGWIAKYIPEKVNVVLDAFSGSQSIAYMFKQLGKQTYTNDFLNFNHQIGLALVENGTEKLNENDIKLLFSENPDQQLFNLFESLFTNLFFTLEDVRFIDSYRGNVELLTSPYKRALAISVLNRCMTRKVTMGHFAHTQALTYAANPERVKRNRSLVRPIKDIYRDILPLYNDAIFDNQKNNKSFNKNILDLLPTLTDVDLVYFDPPYCNSHADYQSFYHLLETYTEYWKDKQFINGTKRYEPKLYSGFDKKNEAIENLKKMFCSAQHIPYWLVSYNDRSYPDIDTMIALISPYRDVKIERKPYYTGRGGKGSVAGSSEILFICNPPL